MRIKHLHLVFLTVASLSCIQCISFNTAYERIDSDATRLLSMQFEPPEAAPGDTVRVMCVFAGDPVNPSDIQWAVSYKVLRNAYGVDTAIDIRPLTGAEIVPLDTEFSPSTYTVAFRMRIPQGIVEQSPTAEVNWTKFMEAQTPEAQSYTNGLTKDGVIGFMDSLLADPSKIDENPIDNFLKATIGSQFLTAPIRLFGNVRGGTMNLVGDFTARYCNAFARIPGIPFHVNHNPTLDSVRILKVKGAGLASFVPGVNSQTYEAYKIFDAFRPISEADSIVIANSYSYFLQAFGSGVDSLNLLYDTSIVEQLGYQWFFQVDSATAKNVKSSDLPAFTQFGFLSGAITSFTPAMDSRVTSVRWWVQVYDQLTFEEVSRPQGCSLHEMTCNFKYTQAYLDYVQKMR